MLATEPPQSAFRFAFVPESGPVTAAEGLSLYVRGTPAVPFSCGWSAKRETHSMSPKFRRENRSLSSPACEYHSVLLENIIPEIRLETFSQVVVSNVKSHILRF